MTWPALPREAADITIFLQSLAPAMKKRIKVPVTGIFFLGSHGAGCKGALLDAPIAACWLEVQTPGGRCEEGLRGPAIGEGAEGLQGLCRGHFQRQAGSSVAGIGAGACTISGRRVPFVTLERGAVLALEGSPTCS